MTTIEKAKQLADQLGVKVVFQNSKGEWFTQKNDADNSDKKENVKEFDFSEDTPTAKLAEAVANKSKKKETTKPVEDSTGKKPEEPKA